eukprot:NODE_180_length_15790_cov_0.586706.p3 type:complete len:574 gc:universal NODE_180_length_15790_cov_0.586706:7779-9500(+)
MSSLLYQILIPFQISIPCIYPSSTFEYSFRLLDDTTLKVDLSPYPMKVESRFFTASVSFAGMTGEGYAFISKDRSCEEHPPLTVDFTIDETSYRIQKKNNIFVVHSNSIDEDLKESPENEKLLCGTDSVDPFLANNIDDLQMGLDEPENSCPKVTQYLDIGIAVDCSVMRQSYSIDAATHEILSNVAQTNIAYKKSFNIQLIVTKLDIRSSCSQKYTGDPNEVENGSTEYDRWNIPCRSDYSLVQRFVDFSIWRGERKDTLGLWHLFSSCSTDGKVGLAWPTSVCRNESMVANDNLYSNGAGISTRQRTSWKIMAHEIAHNLGAIHDCLAPNLSGCCKCSESSNGDCNSRYLMNPSQKVITEDFSPCTVSTVCDQLSTFNCLSSDPSSADVFSKNTCGNGILEEGEECDCGDLCESDRCCTDECKLTPGSFCSDKNQACCSECQIEPKNKICRKKEGVCDYSEVCNGLDADCPQDIFVDDGETCSDEGISNGSCASKYCTSADKQCTDIHPSSKGACASAEISANEDECVMSCIIGGKCVKFESLLIAGTLCGNGYGKCNLGSCEFASSCKLN